MKKTEAKSLAIINDYIGVKEITAEDKILPLRMLGIDSLDKLELVMKLEKEHGIKISDPVEEEWKTAQDIIDGIEDIVNPQSNTNQTPPTSGLFTL